MKKNYPLKRNFALTVFSVLFVTLMSTTSLSAQVGIGTSNPDPSSILHIQSSDKGVLLPKVDLKNLKDKNTVNNPTEGLLVYNKNEDNYNNLRKGFYIWDNEKWDKVENKSDVDEVMEEIDERIKELEEGSGSGGSGWSLEGNNFDNVNNADKKFLGTTTWHSLFLRSNNKQIAEFDPHGGIALGFNTKADWAGVAIGNSASITADEAVAIGKNAKSGSRSISLGNGALATNDEAIGLGFNANSSGSKATAIGHSAKASANQSVALGQAASASGSSSFAIGSNAQATQNVAFAIGNSAKATSNEAFAIGTNASSSSDQGMAIGVGATTKNQQNAFAIGVNSEASGNNSMAIGHSSNVSGQYAAAIGYNSKASQQNATALGSNSNANAQNSTAIGYQSTANTAYSIVLGNNTAASNWNGSKIGIGTSDPTAKLHVNGSLRIVDGTQGENKVLTSDAQGNASWKDLNGNSGKVYGDLYVSKRQAIPKDGNAYIAKFDKTTLSKNIQQNNNGIQVKESGIFKVNATISIRIDDSSAEDDIYEFYLAIQGQKIVGSTVYMTFDPEFVKVGKKHTVALNKLMKLEKNEQVAVYVKKAGDLGLISVSWGHNISLMEDACSLTLEKIDGI
ncbi:hypothetical protein [Zunongwangia pacifica]|uniref:Trimeric autotransporter adhesin YadA-like head domain-containing protein n=1 Tax=Zunongwangia pacifica TaxID=2911062 RepID=A0A9X2CN38_9FLAO|nr:hypothetical protein [Zunongwangia pacifica]MCL6220170.1 hypothetical protein [Zunongwangia pacifica]